MSQELYHGYRNNVQMGPNGQKQISSTPVWTADGPVQSGLASHSDQHYHHETINSSEAAVNQLGIGTVSPNSLEHNRRTEASGSGNPRVPRLQDTAYKASENHPLVALPLSQSSTDGSRPTSRVPRSVNSQNNKPSKQISSARHEHIQETASKKSATGSSSQGRRHDEQRASRHQSKRAANHEQVPVPVQAEVAQPGPDVPPSSNLSRSVSVLYNSDLENISNKSNAIGWKTAVDTKNLRAAGCVIRQRLVRRSVWASEKGGTFQKTLRAKASPKPSQLDNNQALDRVFLEGAIGLQDVNAVNANVAFMGNGAEGTI
ncbi:hypothetical protein HD806DRAFT_550581 [Xylariaceae sp. AK1471]|nr:hypothetical protein HD806DRAFT_550581 [Xylariaceae sp. AK1471]